MNDWLTDPPEPPDSYWVDDEYEEELDDKDPEADDMDLDDDDLPEGLNDE